MHAMECGLIMHRETTVLLHGILPCSGKRNIWKKEKIVWFFLQLHWFCIELR